MIISIINGSPRSKGATGTILTEMKNYLEKKDDVTVNYIDLSKLNMKFCNGCIHCYKTGTCLIKDDDIEKVAAMVKASDGIIIGSPTYGSNISGMLKNFIDRGHFILEQALRNKKGFALSTYGIAEGHQVVKILKKFFLVSGGSRAGDMRVKIDFNNNPLLIEHMVKKIHKKMDVLYAAIKFQKSKSLFERFFNELLLVKVIWKPIFLKNRAKYAGILNAWEQMGIL